MSASHPWISELYDSNWQATAHAHTGSWSQGHSLIFWSMQHSATLGFTCELKKIIIIIKIPILWHTVAKEPASCLQGKDTFLTLGCSMQPLSLQTSGLRSCCLVGWFSGGGHCRWSWSQTTFWAGGGSSPFSILSLPAPILGLATVPLTCQKLRSQNRCWDLGCKSLVLRIGPSAKPL